MTDTNKQATKHTHKHTIIILGVLSISYKLDLHKYPKTHCLTSPSINYLAEHVDLLSGHASVGSA